MERDLSTLGRLILRLRAGQYRERNKMIVLNPNELLPGDDQPVLHVAAGQEDLLGLLRSPEYGPGLTVIPRVSVLRCPPAMATVRSEV